MKRRCVTTVRQPETAGLSMGWSEKEAPMSKEEIVVIDDDQMFLTLAGAILESVGYRIHAVSDGDAARGYIMGGARPAMVIVDVMMPTLMGDEVVKLLKQNPETESIPVLFLSGMSVEELAELAQRTGADGYLTKPFSFDQLVESVRKMIRQR